MIIKRNVANLIIKRYLPSFLMVVIAFSTFWMPTSASTARVGLSISSLFALISQQSHEELSVSYMHAINVWMFLCIAFVFSTLIEFSYASCVTIDNNHNNDHNKTDDKADEQMVDHSLNQVQCQTNDDRPLTKLVNLAIKINSANNCVDIYSRIAFPVLFFIVIIVYSIVYIY